MRCQHRFWINACVATCLRIKMVLCFMDFVLCIEGRTCYYVCILQQRHLWRRMWRMLCLLLLDMKERSLKLSLRWLLYTYICVLGSWVWFNPVFLALWCHHECCFLDKKCFVRFWNTNRSLSCSISTVVDSSWPRVECGLMLHSKSRNLVLTFLCSLCIGKEAAWHRLPRRSFWYKG